MMHIRDKKYYLLSQFSDISFVNLEYRSESVNSFSYDSDVICSNPLQKVKRKNLLIDFPVLCV